MDDFEISDLIGIGKFVAFFSLLGLCMVVSVMPVIVADASFGLFNAIGMALLQILIVTAVIIYLRDKSLLSVVYLPASLVGISVMFFVVIFLGGVPTVPFDTLILLATGFLFLAAAVYTSKESLLRVEEKYRIGYPELIDSAFFFKQEMPGEPPLYHIIFRGFVHDGKTPALTVAEDCQSMRGTYIRRQLKDVFVDNDCQEIALRELPDPCCQAALKMVRAFL